jgi:hypothetical protein
MHRYKQSSCILKSQGSRGTLKYVQLLAYDANIPLAFNSRRPLLASDPLIFNLSDTTDGVINL